MSLLQKIDTDYIEAYKAKATVKVAVLRHLKTAIQTRMAEGRGKDVTDDDVLDLIAKQVKQRKDSFEQYTSAGRDDLARVEAEELAELEQYLPRPLGDEALAAAIDKAVADLGATGVQDMGKVMQAVLSAHKGQVDGKKASALVRSRLSA
ncbi:MAG: GatB/YqeY domain-containing protein [Pseudodesulfovibrio sp.]|uniref:GatB/YqeY family protein n=1 Tax=Pseudodesulfovibrio aespoeensis (strain ATCC 700646 / DSM 10631 / Aspo-2) TaxID=643562 RepID=E6VWL4_PSEA9|nr:MULTISPECIES: GatB/YqeY domain-containing protein [Pseudodesulfovibrio]MBU4242730.1 GatB/YqeY domain-containing protein [Pseudomonadota bacterium]ADU62515.1 GatB/YqeY family protein [Pseudodesulfovibrio aespoeensis Aspo-2]MBU4377823.1 GatB/YqeY domain-containing protein [Pseudomonadota bacterium]MBU4473869.1 GatB/YqeY domain-containing protein [Pseudomonadota bacterium]MBU4516588.1 GatB/YqeY domain-containing protein [Pseudomonadota bacterium]